MYHITGMPADSTISAETAHLHTIMRLNIQK